MPADRLKVEVEGRSLELSNLDKVLYPGGRLHQGRGDRLLHPDRPGAAAAPARPPLTRIRFPNGVDGGSFFEKNAPAATPAWVRTENLPAPGSSKGRETIDYVVCDELPTLVWLANLAALELHTPQWKIGAHPDMMVVDLDPGAPAALKQCCQVALLMRDRLAADGSPRTRRRRGRRACSSAARSPAPRPPTIVSDYAQADRAGTGAGDTRS